MYEEESGEQILGSGAHCGQAMGEASIQQACQGKVEVTGKGQSHLSVHLTQGPLQRVTCGLHHFTQILIEKSRDGRKSEKIRE